jgi:hypothetical protein
MFTSYCGEYVVLLDNFTWIVLALYTIIEAEMDWVWSKEVIESNRFKRAIMYNRE